MVNSIGLLGCRMHNCFAGGAPVFKHVTLTIGCDYMPERAATRLLSFTNTLRMLKRPLLVENLRIELKNYCFRNDGQVTVFAEQLKNIHVQKSFCLSGSDFHLERQVRKIPMGLGMQIQPTKSAVRFRGSAWHDLGEFEAFYTPETGACAYEADIHVWNASQTLDDPTSQYANWSETAGPAKITNGLDYVTEPFSDIHF